MVHTHANTRELVKIKDVDCRGRRLNGDDQRQWPTIRTILQKFAVSPFSTYL